MKCTYRKQISPDLESVCNGEMVKVGIVDYGEVTVGNITLYQCEKCKTIKLY